MTLLALPITQPWCLMFLINKTVLFVNTMLLENFLLSSYFFYKQSIIIIEYKSTQSLTIYKVYTLRVKKKFKGSWHQSDKGIQEFLAWRPQNHAQEKVLISSNTEDEFGIAPLKTTFLRCFQIFQVVANQNRWLVVSFFLYKHVTK
jgi:hypothetical protein